MKRATTTMTMTITGLRDDEEKRKRSLSSKNHIFKTKHGRKILLTESRGNKSFFIEKVVSNFDFGHFLEK